MKARSSCVNWFALAVMIGIAGLLPAKAVADDDLDNYKVKAQAFWWFSAPSGYFNGTNGDGYFDVKRDLGFGNYSTFSGNVDYRISRKNHLLFGISPITSNRTATLNRTIDWQGQTFDVGATVNSNIKTLAFSVGYQYDIFRRKQWNMGVQVNVVLLQTEASITATGAVSGGGTASTSASGSYFAPLPVVGPEFRWYLIPNSTKVSLEGALTGMYFFGYGDFVAAKSTLGIRLTPHLDLRAGYQMGSRLSIHGTSDRIGIRLTQKGPVAGLEYRWGQK